MAAPLDWAALSEADEDSRQALLQRAAKIEPSLQHALQSSSKKARKKNVDNSETSDKKVAKSTCGKKAGSKKTRASAVVAAVEEEMVVGGAAWVTKEMQSVGLEKFVARLTQALQGNLELLVHVDQAQLDILLQQSKSESFPDTIDYIKLQCVIRAMHVKVAGMTGTPTLSRRLTTASSTTTTNDSSDSASSSAPQKDVAALLQSDILQWSVSDAMTWMKSVPALGRFVDLFERLSMDGHRLLRLNDRKLVQRVKMESDADRELILRHVADLKALQFTRAVLHHSDILNKLIEGLATDLAHMNKVVANPVTSMLASKRVPNYFISLRIGAPTLKATVKKIQGEIEALLPDLAGSRSVLPPEQLHFTLGRLYLQTEEEIALAKQLLEQCHSQVYKVLYPEGAEVAVNFRGVMNYGGNTVFLETERGNERDNLIEFGNSVYDLFQAAGLTSKEFRFQPVAPILRVRQSKKPLIARLQEVSDTLLKTYDSALLGRNVFTSLDISAVADQTDADGYYCNLHTVSLK